MPKTSTPYLTHNKFDVCLTRGAHMCKHPYIFFCSLNFLIIYRLDRSPNTPRAYHWPEWAAAARHNPTAISPVSRRRARKRNPIRGTLCRKPSDSVRVMVPLSTRFVWKRWAAQFIKSARALATLATPLCARDRRTRTPPSAHSRRTHTHTPHLMYGNRICVARGARSSPKQIAAINFTTRKLLLDAITTQVARAGPSLFARHSAHTWAHSTRACGSARSDRGELTANERARIHHHIHVWLPARQLFV